jgi:hypothetical protein
VRDKRHDWLYERQKQPIKQYLLERFAGQLADELSAWPPADLEWETEALQRRWQAGAAGRPGERVVRYALELARLDLRRQWEEIDRRLQGEADAWWTTPEERSAGQLLVKLLTERCLWLKEEASGARLTRDDLCAALGLVEQHLFKVTVGSGH